MAKRVFKAVGPCGAVFQRGSQSRVYSHAILSVRGGVAVAALSWAGSAILAEKEARKLRGWGCYEAVVVVPVQA